MLIWGVTLLSVLAALGLCLGTNAFSDTSWLWMLPAGFAGAFLILALLAFLFFWAACAVVRLDKPQEKDSKFYRFLCRLLAEAALPITGVRMHTQGLEKMPEEGRFLLVSNHLNEMDPVILFHYFRKHTMVFVSKRENSSMFMVGKLMHKIMCPLINRENDREALKTILKCVQILKEDKASVAVFPEGYTSVDHKFHHFRCGVFKIAQKAKVPIVVCTITNTHKVFHNALRLKPTDVELHLVAVIQPEEFAGMTTVALGERIYDMMLEDLGPEYAEQNT